MSERAGVGPTEILLMNEYSVGIPLWDGGELIGGDELELSDAMRADLESFANRWEASIPAEVADDRWDGVPVMRWLVRVRYTLQRKLNPAAQRRAVKEDVEIRTLGEELRARLQHELGSDYRVTYRH